MMFLFVLLYLKLSLFFHAMQKSEYRTMMLKNRVNSTAINWCVNQKLINLLSPTKPQNIAGFVAMRQEIDIMPSLTYFYHLGCNIYLPSIINKSSPLHFKAWQPSTQLSPALYGTLEPNTKATVDFSCTTNETNDEYYIIIPCVGVFEHKSSFFRIGYGGGFYDRTINELKKQHIKFTTIGLYHENNIPDSAQINLVPDNHDMPLDLVIHT